MANIVITNNKVLPDSSDKSDFYELVSTATVALTTGTIVNADISASAAIADSKLAQITTAGKIAASALPSGVGIGYTVAFDNADLSTGVLTVTHNLSAQYVTVTVFDNSGLIIIPDSVTATSTSACAVSLVSFGTISGTWNVRVTA